LNSRAPITFAKAYHFVLEITRARIKIARHCRDSHWGGVAMLVLSRKNLESILIGGADGLPRQVEVTVLEICGKRVKLGFEADVDVVIRRSEVQRRAEEGRSFDARPLRLLEDELTCL
jgi:carbon storage regulator CsrA